VLPPDGCTGSAGPSCDNAGPNNDEPGVCVETTCPHRGPIGPDASDFDAETEEPCVLCQVPDGGSSTAPSKSSSGGCSTSPGLPAGGDLGLMLAAGVAIGALQRRRRAV
jgi:MYXO-CTERM domain-containing protein